ncbi:MAG: hypothetical protein E6F97_02140 [Actinobacteria bacterium]|nr:MAG: hypothetical protein E6F97_02140 [Actinomycetota bacterium]
MRFEQVRPAVGGQAVDPVLRVEEVIRARRPAFGVGLHLLQQVVEIRVGGHVALAVRGRPGGVVLEVVELQLCRRPDDLGRLRRVVDASQLDHDLVLALLADLGLGDAERVDAVTHDRDRGVHAVRRDLLVPERDRLEHDLQAALEVEPQRDLLVGGRARQRKCHHADERQHDQAHENQIRTSVRHEKTRNRLAVVGGKRLFGDALGLK